MVLTPANEVFLHWDDFLVEMFEEGLKRRNSLRMLNVLDQKLSELIGWGGEILQVFGWEN